MKSILAMVIGLGLATLAGAPATAGDRKDDSVLTDHPKSGYYRRGPQVRGYATRRGGYSYNYADSIDTYGNARTLYGGTNLYRDPMLDRQTNSGPFDHGFFFDSGMGPNGGQSPYMH